MFLLQLVRASKKYSSGDESFYALKETNLCFEDKGFVGIQGKSGSGKSTLLSLILGINPPSKGKVLFLGQDIYAMKPKQRERYHRQGVAVVFQHYNLISGAKAIDNVMMPLLLSGVGKKKARQKALALLSRFSLEKMAEKRIEELSGGEKQRVALARALVCNPKILIADEPTGALDEHNAQIVMEILKEEASQRLVLCVSHNDALLANFATRTLLIKEGEVKEEREEAIHPCNKIDFHKEKTSARPFSFFLKRNLVRNRFKNILLSFSLVTGVIGLCLTAGFYEGIPTASKAIQNQLLQYGCARISENVPVDIPDSPLRLIQQKRPELSLLAKAFASSSKIRIGLDYSPILPRVNAYRLEEMKKDPVSFSLLPDDLTKSKAKALLKEGRIWKEKNHRECIVNEEFIRESKGRIGDVISLENSISFQGKNTIDKKHMSFIFEIVGVVSEFSFLNQPRVYVSYEGLEERLSNEILLEISVESEEDVSVVDYLSRVNNDDPISGFGYCLFANGKEAEEVLRDEYKKRKESESSLQIESDSFFVEESFVSLTSSFASSFLVFVVVAFAGLALLLGMSSYSSWVAWRKESAILLVLGARKEDLVATLQLESVLIALISAIVALAISPLFSLLANTLIQTGLGVGGLIRIPFLYFRGFLFGFPFLLIHGVAILSSLSSGLPLLLSSPNVAEALRDE